MVDFEAYKNRKNSLHNSVLLTILWGIFTTVVIALFFAVRYLMDNWADLTVEELLFHLKTTLEGTNPEMIRQVVLYYVVPAVLLLALLFTVLYKLQKKPKYRNRYMAGVFAAGLITLFAIKGELDKKIGLSDYFISYLSAGGRDFIAENYVDPDSVEITFPEQKRNLIYIFLESVEMTYTDVETGGAFEKNVIPELTELALENEDFSGEENILNGGISLPGSNWTMGAMFAMGTGMPLKVSVNCNTISSEEEFYPSIRSLGTILEKQGYRQELLIGSEDVFGGRGFFYRGHGNFDIRDYIYMKENGRIPEDYYVFWGYEDEKLFQFAREDLLELAADGRPFNLTMLTVDTHFPDGYRCRLCQDEFGEQYADVFACSSRQVNEFVEWIQQQDFYENTTIVICGDHPTMDNDFCLNVPDDYQRRTYVAVINGKNPDQDTWNPSFREYSTMDLFPTTLAAMNVRIEGNRLGLGTNLYSEEETLIEKYGKNECVNRIGVRSAFMDKLSGMKVTEELLEELPKRLQFKANYIDDDTVEVTMLEVGSMINREHLIGAKAEITDLNTQITKEYKTEIGFYNDYDPNYYYISTKCDLDGRSPEDLKVTFYISTDGFSDYKIAEVLIADKLEKQ